MTGAGAAWAADVVPPRTANPRATALRILVSFTCPPFLPGSAPRRGSRCRERLLADHAGVEREGDRAVPQVHVVRPVEDLEPAAARLPERVGHHPGRGRVGVVRVQAG